MMRHFRDQWAAAVRYVRANVSLRDATILFALVMVWRGLSDIYQPLAPCAVGAFLLWYTTVRRVAP